MTKDLEALIAFSRAAMKGPWERGAFIVAASPSVVLDLATRLMKAEAENIRLALELKKAFNKEDDYVNQIEDYRRRSRSSVRRGKR